jgi:hypothetical protein
VEATPGLEGRCLIVVGIDYSPEQSGIAPDSTHACEFLAEIAADVFVLAGNALPALAGAPLSTAAASAPKRATAGARQALPALHCGRHGEGLSSGGVKEWR